MRYFFVTDAVQIRGGAEFSFYRILEGLKGKHEIIVAAPPGEYADKLGELGLNIKLMEMKVFRHSNPLPFIKTVFRLNKEIKAFNPDWVYANGFNACEFSCLAAKLSGKKYGYYVRDFPEILDTWLRKYCFKKADKLIANSQAVKREMVEFFSLNPEKIEVVYPQIDTDKFKPLPASNAQVKKVKKELGLQGKFVVGCFGRISREKGQDYLIEAVKQLNNPKIKLLIVGDSKIGSKEFESELREQAKGLGDNCLFLGFRNDLVELINACDLVVCPSKKEPFGRVIVEAIACGKPVIATDTCGAKEIGFQKLLLVGTENYKAISQAISIATKRR